MFPNRRHLPAAILLALSVSWYGAAAASQDSPLSADAEPAPSQSVASPSRPKQVKDLSAVKVEQRIHEGGRALYQDEQRYAPVITEVLGAEQISHTGDSDAGTTLKRVTGLSLLEGKYVYVRGLGDRYSSVTLNGAPVPSPDPTRRVVPLDLFPTDLLEGIVVQKAYTPDRAGEFGGGNVELRTRNAPKGFFLRLNTTLGVRDGTSFSQGRDYRGGGHDWTGHDDGSRALPDSLAGAVSDQRFLRPRNPQNPNGVTPEQIERYGEDVAATGFDLHSRRLPADKGISGAIGNRFELGDDVRLGVIGALRYNNAWHHSNETRRSYIASTSGLFVKDALDVEDTSNDIDTSGFLHLGAELGRFNRLNFTSVLLRQTEDRSKISDGTRDEQQARFYDLRWTENQLAAQQLSGQHTFPSAHGLNLDWRYTYARTTRDEPAHRQYRYDYLGEDTMAFSQRADSNQIGYGTLDDHQRNGALSLKLPLDFDSGAMLNLSAGAERTRRDRHADQRYFSFRGVGPESRDESLLEQPPGSVLTADTIGPNGFALTETTTATDNYFADQRIDARFVNADFTSASGWRMSAGARREDNRQHVTTFSIANPQATPIEAGIAEADWLPALAVTIPVGQDSQVRFNASRTLSRPDFRELSPAAYNDPLLDVGVLGNPKLKTTHITNADLRYEHYFSSSESLALGVFWKHFEQPIEKVRLPGSGTLLTLQNALGARNYGVELEIYKQLDILSRLHWLPQWDWSHFYVSGNYARIRSAIQLDPALASYQTNLDRPMQGQSPYTGNLQLGYIDPAGRREFSLLYNVSGRRISQLGVAGQPDIYEEPFGQLDMLYRQRLAHAWDLKLRLRNLLDPEVRYTQGGMDTRRFRRGREVLLSAQWRMPE